MLRKSIALLLVCLHCIGLVACGEAESDKDTVPATGSAAQTGKVLSKIRSYDDKGALTAESDCVVSDGTITISTVKDGYTIERVFEYDPTGYEKPIVWEAYYEYLDYHYADYPKEIGNPLSILEYQNDRNNADFGERYEYEGNIQRNYYSQDGKPSKLEQSEHDANGITTKMTITDTEDGSFISEHIYRCSYDDAGHTVKVADGGGKHEKDADYSGADDHWIELEYDAAGNITRITEFNEGKSIGGVAFAYDAAGNLIKKTVSYLFGVYIDYNGYTDIEYDTEGHMLKKTEYHEDGTLKGYTEYIYR